VHGANRLGGNGVAESTVFGGLAGDAMAEFVVGRAAPRPEAGALAAAAGALAAPLGRPRGGPDCYALWRELRAVMWDRAGLLRDGAGLAAAAREVERLAALGAAVGVEGGPAFNVAWQDWLNFRSQTTAARLIIASALARRESRGAHYRQDFPAPDRGPLYSVRVRAQDGAPVVWTEPVALTRARPPATAAPVAVETGD
jgi:fumarate reductase flavoprotein subunit